MTDTLLKDLNQDQQKAVLATDGPIIILAGAGSGKTRVLTHKVIYLILEKKVTPESILCITFTNKAASEMKERIARLLPNPPWVSTFHSLCAKILRMDGGYIGFSPKFAIYDTQDQLEAIKEAMNRLSISVKDFKPSSVHATISQAKNELIDAKEYPSVARGYFQETVVKIYTAYQSILKEGNALDFDDLILQTIRLFKENDQVLKKYQNRFQYLLIDEYQDTNKAQYMLTRFLSAKYQNICVVGDFSQSIYSWRGADYRNLMKFKDDYKGTLTFSLERNYRSTQRILDGASTIVAKNMSHPVLKLWTKNPQGEEIEIYEAANEQDEAEFIIRKIIELNIKNLHEVAVLYRTNAQSRVLEEVLLHHSVPYLLIGGTRFYERKEIKDVLSYLRIIENPKDMISYKRAEKIGKGRLAKFLEYKDSIQQESKAPDITDALDALATAAFDADTPDTSLPKTINLLDGVVRATGYLDLYDEKIEEDRMRLENIKELRSVAISFPDLTNFLENVALVEQEYLSEPQVNGEKRNAITLMTFHAAKGLEFPAIFMIGMEEGLFPHSRSLMDKSQLEEERRLCYVGMTRAKDRLFLTHARRRLFFGTRAANTVSRFVLELPENLIIKKQAEY